MTSAPRLPAVGSRVLISIATIVMIVSIVVTWVRVQLLDTGGWTRTATATLQNPQVRQALANAVSDRLLQVVDFDRLAGERLPQRAAPAGPLLAAAAAEVVPPAVSWALGQAKVQHAWSLANRMAHRELLTVLDGGRGALRTDHGVIAVNLETVLNAVGSTLRLGSIGSRLTPQRRLLVLMHSRALETGQRIVRALKALAWVLPVAAALLYLLATALARGRRRRALLEVGAAIAIGALLSLLLRRWVVSYVVNGLVAQQSLRPAVRAVMAISTADWRDGALWLLAGGLLVGVCAILAGPAAVAVRCRRALAGPLERHPGWIIAGLVTVAVVVATVGPGGTPIQSFPLVSLLAGAVIWMLALRRQIVDENRAAATSGPGAPSEPGADTGPDVTDVR